MSDWKQFTLYPLDCRNAFYPLQAMYAFMPRWLEANKQSIIQWHLLYEPGALVRFRVEHSEQFEACLSSADEIAGAVGLVYVVGDASADWNRQNLASPDEDYFGEKGEYGDDLWEANAKFMQACGELAMATDHLPEERQIYLRRKFAHLYANIMGMNLYEESSFAKIWHKRALKLSKKFGRM